MESGERSTSVTVRGVAVVWYSIGVDQPVVPTDPLPAPPAIPRGALVIVEGRAPVWRYGLAFHSLHASPAGAIATYDPRLGAVIVASHRREFAPGETLDLTPPST
jgi:CRISPR-associated protein Csx3